MVTSQPPFSVVSTYNALLSSDPDLTMPVAAIESLILALAEQPSSTVAEALDQLQKHTTELKKSHPNSLSLAAGTDLLQQYLMKSLSQPELTGGAQFDEIRAHLIHNGKFIVSQAKKAREQIAETGRQYIRDGDVILTYGGSRCVGALLRSAAEARNGSRRAAIRFQVIYVVESSADSKPGEHESAKNISALRESDIPVAVIPLSAISSILHKVTKVFVGAEVVVMSGGIISRRGTYSLAILAQALDRPFCVFAETHKFSRFFPQGQDDLGVKQNVLDFRTARDEKSRTKDEEVKLTSLEDAVDYTPPEYIKYIITETGVKTPPKVCDELIQIWI